MQALANIKLTSTASFTVNREVKKSSTRALDTVSRTQHVVQASLIDAKGAVGKAARANTAYGANRAIANAMLNGNYQPAVERVCAMADLTASVKSRADWNSLKSNIRFMRDQMPPRYTAKGLPTGKYGTLCDTLLYMDGIDELANYVFAERKAEKEAVEVIAAA